MHKVKYVAREKIATGETNSREEAANGLQNEFSFALDTIHRVRFALKLIERERVEQEEERASFA